MRRGFGAIVTLFALTALPAFPCTCAGPNKRGCQVPQADVVVLARVVSIEHNQPKPAARDENAGPYSGNSLSRGFGDRLTPSAWGSVKVTLEVRDRLRGEASESLVIRTDVSSCGYQFETGQDYLIFATKFQGELTVNICSATQPAKAAASRIRQLRAFREGVLPSLFGSVATYPLQLGENFEKRVQPAPGLTVVAQSGEQEYRTSTAEDGVYEFYGLPRGGYRVHVEAPPGRRVLWHGGVERVHAPAGLDTACPVDFQVNPD